MSIVNSIGSLTTPPRGRRRRRRSRRRRSKSQRVHFTLIGGQLFSVSFCFQFVIDLLLSFLLLLLLLLLILLILLLLLLLLYFVSLFPGNPKYVGGSLAKEPEEVERFSISHFGFGLVWFSFFLWVFFCSQVEMIIYNNHQGRWNRFGTKKKRRRLWNLLDVFCTWTQVIGMEIENRTVFYDAPFCYVPLRCLRRLCTLLLL